MKRFKLYANGLKYGSETEEELLPDLKDELKTIVEKLEVGESHSYKNIDCKTEWTIERFM